MSQVVPLAQPPRLALYLRPGRSGSGRLQELIAQNRNPCDGVVIDSALWSRQAELASVARDSGLEVVLDPRSLELSSAEGHERAGVRSLPWYTREVHTPASLADFGTRKTLISRMADFAVGHNLTAVLAPTHFIQSTGDEWWDIDDRLVAELRRELDQRNAAHLLIYRPIYVHAQVMRDAAELHRITQRLRSSPIDAIWLAVHPFGTSTAGSVALRRYVDGSRTLHEVGVPIVGMHTGTVGVLLMALGAVGGIESGITDGENFNVDQHTKRPVRKEGSKSMGATPRVYIQTLGVFLTAHEAEHFFSIRGMTAQHSCQNGCCPRGLQDMLGNKLAHFVQCRSGEVSKLSKVPQQLRPKVYLDDELRPASDRAIAASRASARMQGARRRLDEWRKTFAGILERDGGALPTISAAPSGKRLARLDGASG